MHTRSVCSYFSPCGYFGRLSGFDRCDCHIRSSFLRHVFVEINDLSSVRRILQENVRSRRVFGYRHSANVREITVDCHNRRRPVFSVSGILGHPSIGPKASVVKWPTPVDNLTCINTVLLLCFPMRPSLLQVRLTCLTT